MALEQFTVLETQQIDMFAIHFWDNGLIYLKVEGETVVEEKHLKKYYDFLKSRYDGKNKFLILVESGYDSTLTKEAREYTALPETNTVTLATAVVVKSLPERLLINFIINVANRQTRKIQLFNTRENAVKWLLSVKKKSGAAKKSRLAAWI